MSAVPDAAARGASRANTPWVASGRAPAPPSLKMAVERAGWTRGGSDAIDARRWRGSGAQLGSRWGCAAAVVASPGAARGRYRLLCVPLRPGPAMAWTAPVLTGGAGRAEPAPCLPVGAIAGSGPSGQV